jgi:hypothetical protein
MSTIKPSSGHTEEAHSGRGDLEAQLGGTSNNANTQNLSLHIHLDNPFEDPTSTQPGRRDSVTSEYSIYSEYKPQTMQLEDPQKKKTRCCTSRIFWIVSIVLLITLALLIVFTVLMTMKKKDTHVRGDDGASGLSKLKDEMARMSEAARRL